MFSLELFNLIRSDYFRFRTVFLYYFLSNSRQALGDSERMLSDEEELVESDRTD